MKYDRTENSRGPNGDYRVGYHSYEYDDFAPPLRISSCGAEWWPAGRSFSRRRSDMFGIEYVAEGDVDFVQNGRRYHVTAGQAYILHRNVAHTYRTGPSGRLFKWFASLEGPLLESLAPAAGLDTCDWVVPEDDGAILTLFKQAMRLFEQRPPDFSLELSATAYRLIVELSRSVAKRYPAQVRAAIQYMDQRLAESVSADEVCRYVGFSATHFNRLFRRHVGLSPKQFFLSRKMAWARHLLRESQLSVKEIATMLGYEDSLYFSAQFKKQNGLSPRTFRRSREE